MLVVAQKGALHLQCIGEADSLRHFAERVCIANGAVEHQARVLAFCGDNVEFAYCGAVGPVLCSVFGSALEWGDPSALDLLLQELLQKCWVLFSFGPIARQELNVMFRMVKISPVSLLTPRSRRLQAVLEELSRSEANLKCIVQRKQFDRNIFNQIKWSDPIK